MTSRPVFLRCCLQLFSLLLLSLFAACRGEDERLVRSETTEVGKKGRSFYLLNEGNMGSNKATLDYYDGRTGHYRRNIFAETNPEVVLDLGDVGNDLQTYGEKLYAVINVSGVVEVMSRRTARHLGKIPIPNCRYIVFHEGYAYVSSYAGKISLDPTARRGYVAKIDTATLQVVDTCAVGYQPEQMAVVGDRLFVANSGGYRAPHYDTTLSVIRLSTFRRERSIHVAPNLHLLTYHAGRLYVQSRGDYAALAPNIYVVDPVTMQVEKSLHLPATRFCFSQGELVALTEQGLHIGQRLLPLQGLQRPYGLSADSNYIYVTDAKDYVSPGEVYCFDRSGQLQWRARTGDIPSSLSFASANLAVDTTTLTAPAIVIDRILTYRPAPGQFVNELPRYEPGDTEATMREKVLQAVRHGEQRAITLGGYGGYVEFALNRPAPNHPHRPDFVLYGNAFPNNSEAGTIAVAYDVNGNGAAEPEEWFEIAGSAHAASQAHYAVTYFRPADAPSASLSSSEEIVDSTYLRWVDNGGKQGYLWKNKYHRQSYFPLWLTDTVLTFAARRLPSNARLNAAGYYELAPFAYGYADNHANTSEASHIDIAWAVDSHGKSVHLPAVHFIRIITGLHQQLGRLGETSTEFAGFRALP